MVHNEISNDWLQIYAHILEMEREGVVTRTFRRLDAERQQAIVQAILDEAMEKGPASINIKEVARKADVAIGSLYQYFGNREGLMDFSTRLSVHLLTGAFEQIAPMLTAMPLREALSAYLMGGLEWGQTMLGLYQFIGRAAYQGDPTLTESVVRPVAVAMRDMMLSILQAAAARGELRPDLDLEAAARAVNAAVIAVADTQVFPFLNIYFQVSDENVPFERTLESTLDLIVRGLSAAGDAK
jgi:AcrR family transcriptional regulator